MRAPIALILLSSLLAPAAVHADSNNANVAVPAVRVSTGVIPPVAINSRDFSVTSNALAGVGVDKPAVVLALKVNEKGLAQDVRIVRSVNPRVDAQVLAAARDFRFRPATLNQHPVPVDLELTVVVQR